MRWLAFLALVPAQAAALSCLPWQVEDAFIEARQSPDRYVIVEGMLRFDPADLPEVDWSQQQDVPPETRIDARLEGETLAGTGFDRDVTLVVQCFGPWCPRPAPDTRHLAFVRETEEGFELRTDPCGGMIFAGPDAELRARVETCAEGGPCTPSQGR